VLWRYNENDFCQAAMEHFKINGIEHWFDGAPEMPLPWYLRDILGLTGTKFGSGMALCETCTVLEKGAAIRSCTKQMRPMSGADITTIEAISAAGPHPVQNAWEEVNALQCRVRAHWQAGSRATACAKRILVKPLSIGPARPC
jgi:isoquinoline 1-oxidoreductase alpha subunit